MGADDRPLTAVWSQWTAADGPSTPFALPATASAFDYWQVTDQDFIDDAWGAIFAVVGQIRSLAPPQYSETFRTLMTVLEESEGPRRLDLTFATSRPSTGRMWEGIIVRVYRELPSGAAPGVAVLLRRWEGGAAEPESVSVWFYSGFVEAPSLSATFEPTGNTWSTRLGPGVTLERGELIEHDSKVLATVLTQTFWQPFAGTAYMETKLARRDAPIPTPPAQPVAGGLELGDRDIDQVFSDSVFAPRLTIFPSKPTQK